MIYHKKTEKPKPWLGKSSGRGDPGTPPHSIKTATEQALMPKNLFNISSGQTAPAEPGRCPGTTNMEV